MRWRDPGWWTIITATALILTVVAYWYGRYRAGPCAP